MIAQHTTTRILLQGIADPANTVQWREFDNRYRPIIAGFCRRLGLTEHDAADVTQETMVRFVKDFRLGKYDPERGKLRSWLIAIAKHRIGTMKHSRARRVGWRGESAFVNLNQEDQLVEHWEKEQQYAILREGLKRLADSTKMTRTSVRAFTLVTVEQRSPQEAAVELGISVEAVYTAKHRCLAQMRTILQEVSQIYEVL